MKLILNWQDDLDDLAKRAGGKAKNLAILKKNKILTPDWFCLSNLCFQNFLKQFEKMNLHEKTDQEIEDLFLAAFLDKDLENEIKPLLKFNSYAIRSSGILEDSKAYSFAGQYSSFLNIQDTQQVFEAIKRCWASNFSDNVRAYRRDRKISEGHAGMGVIIQQMIEADFSGLAYSENPTNKTQKLISSVEGLGNDLASGSVDGDMFFINSDESYDKILTQGKHLSDHMLQSVQQLLSRVENLINMQVDIEWAIKDNTLYCLQARPLKV